MAGNILQESLTPVKPKVLADERIFVYVPIASTSDKGIASFNSTHFKVNNGAVTMKVNNPFEIASLIKLSALEFEQEDETVIIKWPYAHNTSSDITNGYGLVKIATESRGGLKYSEDGLLMIDLSVIPDIVAMQTAINNNTTNILNLDSAIQLLTFNLGETDTELEALTLRVGTNETAISNIVNKVTSIEAGAQVNIIETIKRNGVALIPTAKEIDILVPTAIDNLTSTSTTSPLSANQGTNLKNLIDQILASKGTPDGLAELDFNGKVPLTQINDSILGQVKYKGVWNANTNIPELSSTPSEKGIYYVVSTAGTQFGLTFAVGDWIISNGTTWDKVDNTDAVTSVAGRTGAVTLTKSDVGLGNVDNTSDQNKPISNATQAALDTKQDELVSGVTIKTINNTSLLGSGDIEISGGAEISLNGIDYLKDPDKTYLVIKTPADNDTFELLTGTSGSPNYIIEWGDGESETITTTDNPTHEYETAGMYLITISGSFENGIEVGSSSNANKSKIIEVYGGNNYPTSIGSNAFYICSNLTAVNFPKVTSIGSYAFYGCSNLITASFPKATSIGNGAFQNCTNLIAVNFPRATSVGDYGFISCPGLTTANLPKVTSIGDYAFYGCSNLTDLTIGNVTTTDTGTAFENVKLVNLTIAQDATDTDIERIKQFYADNGGTFTNSYELKHGLQVEKTPTADNDVVRKIDLDAISGGAEISPNGIDYLKDSDKTYLVIKTPADNDTFLLRTGTTGSPNYTIEWGDGTSEAVTTTDNLTHEYETAGMYLITISGAFTNGIVYGSSGGAAKNKIIEVYGGSNYLTSISTDAFDGCTNLTTVNFPQVTSIDTNAFQYCTNLITASFPKVTSIGANAFQNCTNLIAVNFPQATSIGSGAFLGCYNLTTANFPKATSIGSFAFQDCSNLTTVNFPQATTIGSGAFQYCTNLTTANFPQATSIVSYAFRDCTNLTTGNFPQATSIGSFAFYGCSNLTDLTIGNVTTTGIEVSAFENVKLVNLTIAQDVDTTDIDRIKQFYADNGGTFTGAQLNDKLQTVSDEATAETQSLANPDNFYFYEEE